jgi:hypothetical protein
MKWVAHMERMYVERERKGEGEEGGNTTRWKKERKAKSILSLAQLLHQPDPPNLLLTPVPAPSALPSRDDGERLGATLKGDDVLDGRGAEDLGVGGGDELEDVADVFAHCVDD